MHENVTFFLFLRLYICKLNQNKKVMGNTKETIWCGVIDTNYGMIYKASKTKEGLMKQIADYCRENWSIVIDDSEPPTDDNEVIDTYFGDSHREYFDIENVEIK